MIPADTERVQGLHKRFLEVKTFIMGYVSVGVIGIGYLGRYHASKYHMMRSVILGGLSDVEDTYLHAVAKQTGAGSYKDYRQLIGRVDAVSVVTPTPTHFPIAKFFLEHGVHVLIEKPITIHPHEAEELIHIAKINGLILQVGHIERFNPSFIELQKQIKCPMIIDAHRLSPTKKRSLSTNVVLDLMIHDVDLISEIVKSEVKEIECHGNSVVTNSIDIAFSRIRFENGCVANVTASRVSHREVRKFRLFQNGCTYLIDFISRCSLKSRPGSESIYKIEFDKVDILEQELSAFIHSVRYGTQPIVTGKDGLRALKLSREIENRILSDQPSSSASAA